jgi:RNA polymerase sigma-70 factor (ECF subfamily)
LRAIWSPTISAEWGVRKQVELEENLVSVNDDLDSAVDRGLTSQILRRAITHLTEDQRDVIVLRFVAGMPIGEVAEALEKSESAVKGLQRRALIALRKVLADWEVVYVG